MASVKVQMTVSFSKVSWKVGYRGASTIFCKRAYKDCVTDVFLLVFSLHPSSRRLSLSSSLYHIVTESRRTLSLHQFWKKQKQNKTITNKQNKKKHLLIYSVSNKKFVVNKVFFFLEFFLCPENILKLQLQTQCTLAQFNLCKNKPCLDSGDFSFFFFVLN